MEKLEQLDEQATQSLDCLWKMIEKASYGQPGRLLKVPHFLRSSKAKQQDNWLNSARFARYRFDLFVLRPEVIPLPRTACVFWYKSNILFNQPIQPRFSEQAFRKSLEIVGFGEAQISHLSNWLYSAENQDRIQEMDVSELADELKERGVG